jgi:hypothetical protein
MESG